MRLLLACLLASVLTVACSNDGDVGEASDFLIAYTAHGDGEFSTDALYATRADGTEHQKVSGTLRVALDEPSQWHPDGTKLSFLGGPESLSERHVQLAAADGSALEQISGEPGGPGQTTRTSWSPDGERIAYQAWGESIDASEVYVCTVVDLECEKVNGELQEGGGAWLVGWSPDGERIAYVERADDASPLELFTAAADASDRHQVSGDLLEGTHIFPDDVAWSPDGTWLAYLAFQPMLGLYVSSPDGSETHRVSSDLAADVWVFRWRPDGAQIAYAEHRGSRRDLYSNLPDGSAPVLLSTSLSALALVSDFQWSPDGSHVAYLGSDEETEPGILYELHLARADGSSDRVPMVGESTYSFAWSPSGDRIAFNGQGQRPSGIGLYTSASDGTDVRKVSGDHGPSSQVGPFQWSPKALTIAYGVLADPPAESGLFIVDDLEGGDGIAVGHRSELEVRFQWNPDGSRIAYVADSLPEEPTDSPALYTNTADGSDERRVSVVDGPNAHIWTFAWSPSPIGQGGAGDGFFVDECDTDDDCPVGEHCSFDPDGPNYCFPDKS